MAIAGERILHHGLRPRPAPLPGLLLFLLVVLSSVCPGLNTSLAQSPIRPYSLVRPHRLVALYPFDGSAQDAAPSGQGSDGYRRDGTVSGAKLTTAGQSGQSYYFDGTSYVAANVNLNPSALPQVTMGAWVKVVSFNTQAGASTAGFDPTR